MTFRDSHRWNEFTFYTRVLFNGLGCRDGLSLAGTSLEFVIHKLWDIVQSYTLCKVKEIRKECLRIKKDVD